MYEGLPAKMENIPMSIECHSHSCIVLSTVSFYAAPAEQPTPLVVDLSVRQQEQPCHVALDQFRKSIVDGQVGRLL